MKEEIKRTITLTPREVTTILISHLKQHKGIDINQVYFDVNGHNADGDDFAEQPLDFRLDAVICVGKTLI